MTHRLPAALIALCLLSACANVGDLEPAEGSSLPPKPYGAEDRLTAEELIAPSTQARPGRSDELLRRSEKREDDPFYLPPGGSRDPVEPGDTSEPDEREIDVDPPR